MVSEDLNLLGSHNTKGEPDFNQKGKGDQIMEKWENGVQAIQVALLAFFLAIIPVTVMRAGTLTFADATQLSQLSRNGDASSKFLFNATAGVGGGGGVVSSSTNYNNAAAVYPVASTVTSSSSISVSLDYRMQFQSTGPDVRLGFINNSSGAFLGNVMPYADAVWLETYGASNPKHFSFVTPGGAISTGGAIKFPDVTMTAGNWFRIRLDLALQPFATQSYNATATLFDLGVSGLANPTILSTATFQFGDGGLGSQLYPAFFLCSKTTAADNFSATSIPEPSSKGLIGFGLIAMLLCQRARTTLRYL